MSSNHRLSFSLDTHEPGLFLAFDYDTRRVFEYDTRRGDGARGEKQVQNNPYCRMVKRARSSVGRFVKHLRSNLSRTPQHQQQSTIPADGRPLEPSRHSVSMTHQQRCPQFGDSHQSEAIEDCINFLKNSSRKDVHSSCQLQHLPHNLQK